jgi:hypothetical protein
MRVSRFSGARDVVTNMASLFSHSKSFAPLAGPRGLSVEKMLRASGKRELRRVNKC